jgi:hypothetical protein
MKKVVQQLQLEARLNLVKVSQAILSAECST